MNLLTLIKVTLLSKIVEELVGCLDIYSIVACDKTEFYKTT